MKKFIKYLLFFVFVLIMFSTKEIRASTGSTVFIGEPAVLDSYENVEITLNDVEINEETSEVKNTHLFTNLSDTTITRKASIKLEDSFSNFTINSLKIIVNGYEIKEISKEGDNYIFSFQIPPNEGKKIEIIYKTDNDLQNAKIIKYSLDKLKGKYIGKFSINILFQEADIPLVEKIYPSCYEFDYTNNTMNTTYYSFTVNNLTRNFIVQKDTYKNLIYGRGEELSENDLYILKNAKNWIKDGVELNYNNIGKDTWGDVKYYRYKQDLEEQLLENKQITEHENENNTINMIKKYVVYKQLKKDDKTQYINELIKDDYYEGDGEEIFFMLMDGYNPLVFDYFVDNILSKDLDQYYGYKACVDYVKSEGEKDLYVQKNKTAGIEEFAEYGYFKKDEFSILRTKNKDWTPDRITVREIIINEDIDGNEIEATEEEKIEYVNMLNADLYIREVIYDGNTEIDENEEGKKNLFIKSYVYGYYSNTGRRILETSGYEENEWHTLKDFKNEYVENNSQIPTFANAIGYLGIIENKYVVKMQRSSGRSPYDYIKTVKSDLAQELVKENRAKNEEKKNSIETKISNLKISEDTEEYKDRIETINVEKDNEDSTFIEKNKKNNIIMKLIENNKLYIIIALAILIIFIILVILIKRRKNNGRK